MRGEILHYDQIQGFGFIAGADGNRYTFRREDLRGSLTPAKGVQVEFQASRDQARKVSAHAGQAGRPTGPVTGPLTGPATGPTTGSAIGPAMGPAREQTTSKATGPVAGPMGVRTETPASGHHPAQMVPAGHFGRNGTGERAGSTGMWSYFTAAITSNYADFRGRARRKEYWSYVLFMTIAMVVLVFAGALIDMALGNFNYDYPMPFFTFGLATLVTLASIVPSIAIAVRRQHDIGLSGWFYLLIFLPYVGGLILFVFSLIPSQGRENRWGPVPAGVSVPPPYVAPAAST